MQYKKNKTLLLKCSYIYLFIGFSFFIFVTSYCVREADKPLGYAFSLMGILFNYIVYVLINHIFIRKMISHKILFLIESLLLAAMVALMISDLLYITHVLELRQMLLQLGVNV